MLRRESDTKQEDRPDGERAGSLQLHICPIVHIMGTDCKRSTRKDYLGSLSSRKVQHPRSRILLFAATCDLRFPATV